MREKGIMAMLAPIRTGTVAPGSKAGQEIIKDALHVDPYQTANLIRPLDPDALRQGMRSLGLPERQITELLQCDKSRSQVINDPFTPPAASAPATPFEDPGVQIMRGPTPPWSR